MGYTPPGLAVRTLPSRSVDYETVTVDNTVGGVGFTVSKALKCDPEGSVSAVLETAEIRFTCDGTAPTTTVGIPLEPGQTLTLKGVADILGFRAIRTTGTSGKLNCQFFQD